MHYRKEIDGLRAVAVIPVIFFHAGFEVFHGGFVGVDVFFVISGYLITSLIIAEQHNGKFSLLNFYERRARRILPALFLVLFLCLPFAWLWLVPRDFKLFSKSLVAVSVFSSNIIFWKESGYFDGAAELKPLLHTWSLAVEEQFYLLFPLLLIATRKAGRRWSVPVLIAVAVISLIAAQWGAHHNPSATFYLLPTRAWELLIGALAAFYLFKKTNPTNHKVASEIGGLLGLGLIGYAIFTYDSNTPFPSVYALAPTIGTALIILLASSGTMTGKLLGSKALVSVGLISYSAYLWHQPLFAFAKLHNADHASKALLLALALCSFLLAFGSWKYVEIPFRNRNTLNRTQVFRYSIFASSFFILIGVAGFYSNGFESRFNLPKSIADSFTITTRANECFDKSLVHSREDWYCDIGNSDNEVSFIFFGDSHSLSMLDVFNEAALANHKHGIFVGASGCTPFLGIHALRSDQAERNCFLLNERVHRYAKEFKIPKVFLAARWTYYTDGGYAGTNFSHIGLDQNDKNSKQLSRNAFIVGLKKTIDAYSEIGTKLYIITQAPQQRYEPKDVYYKFFDNNEELLKNNLAKRSISTSDHRHLQSFVAGAFTAFAKDDRVTVINLDNIYCNDDKCLIGNEHGSFYKDNNHLSFKGEMLILNTFEKYLAE